MSFSIANTGLSAVTEQLNTISNNIANSATKGYKSSRTEFGSMYAQSQPLGVAVTGVSQSISKEGSINRTDKAMDLAISGGGFFVVKDSAGDTAYTRAGAFDTDNNGKLVNSAGLKLQGYPADALGNLQTGIITDLQVNSAGIPAKASSKLELMANIQATANVPTTAVFSPTDSNSFNFSTTSTIYDSLGREHALSQYFIKQAAGEWTVEYTVDSVHMGGAAHTLRFGLDGALNSATAQKAALSGAFSSPGAAAYSIDIDYSGSTQFNGAFIATKNKSDGYTAGSKNGERIESDGSLYATFSNGERMLQGKLVLANFANPNGLATKNGTSWSETGKSGAALLGAPGTGLLGNVEAGALESSNVDLTAELVGLMTAQRNYQANTKIISTNDSMMNALFQVL